MNRPFNIYYNNATGRLILQKKKVENDLNDNEFNNKIEQLKNITNINDGKNIKINNNLNNNINNLNNSNNNNNGGNGSNIGNLNNNNKINNVGNLNNKINVNNTLNKINDIKKNNNLNNNLQDNLKFLTKKEVFFGIKKTILSEFNHNNQSSNNNDFKIGINKNINKKSNIFDTFYLFPNISEINTKNETNFINEKRVELFNNINNIDDKQYFPIDYIPCGINIPLKNKNASIRKIIIKNIFWNIFQSININKYNSDELLCIVPERNDFDYKNIKLQINFELHSQVNNNIIEKFKGKILPYINLDLKNNTPANSCLYPTEFIEINTLNGSYFNNLEINLNTDLDIQCALLCVKISVPDDCIGILKGCDKMDRTFFGNIPFSQFILNFDYELI